MLLEILAVVFTFICVYLTTKNKVLAWPIGIIAVSLYLVLFFQVQLYAEVITQLVFLIQSFYGWYNWSKIKDKPPAPITRLTRNEKWKYTELMMAGTGFLYVILEFFTNASIPFADSFTTSVSLTANWLLAKRKLENWWLWIFIDLFYVFMFIYKALFWTAGLYGVLFFMAIYGLMNWQKEYKTQFSS